MDWKIGKIKILFLLLHFFLVRAATLSHFMTRSWVWSGVNCEEEGEVFISISFVRHGNIRFSRTLASDITVNNSLQQNGIQILYFSLRRIYDLILFWHRCNSCFYLAVKESFAYRNGIRPSLTKQRKRLLEILLLLF